MSSHGTYVNGIKVTFSRHKVTLSANAEQKELTFRNGIF